MAQSIVKRGSVVLIRYPFTDLTGAKVRPALVLTPDHLLSRLEDVLCLFISSAMPEELLPTDFILEEFCPSNVSILLTYGFYWIISDRSYERYKSIYFKGLCGFYNYLGKTLLS
jgi:hypothetical protein